jgi:hypothetical protein
LSSATGGTVSYNQPGGAGNGIGAFISTTGTFTTIDGVTINGNTSIRILVKDEANAAFNGVYTYTNATAITRSTDADQAGVGNINRLGINDYFFTLAGSVNNGTAFIVSAPSGTITFGTSNIQFSVFSTSQIYTGGTGITVSGTVTPVQAFTNSNLKLRIAVVERRTENNVASNGETEFFNVMKKMLPNATGTTISFAAGTAVPYSQSFTFPGNYRLPSNGQAANIINLATENSVENFWNLSAVVFVEDDTKKEVWQSQSSAAVFPLEIKQVNSTPQFNIYPNPAQNNFSIEFKSNTEGSVRIFDISGKVVLNTTINSISQTIDCSNLNNGLYIVQIEANGTLTSQKLNISK